jgi:hypothetical protein
MTDSQVETFRAALKEARASFERASERLSEVKFEQYRLNDEIGRLRRTITALAAMCSESPWSDALGITDSCVEVMETEREEVSTQDVVGSLEQLGFDFSSQKNPGASVHAILSRLAEKKKITKVTDEDTGAVTWRGPGYVARARADDLVQSTEITDDDIPF